MNNHNSNSIRSIVEQQPKMPNKIRLGVVQSNTLPTKSHNLASIASYAHQAASSNVGLLLFPEAYLGGYPRGSYFGCKIGSRTAEGRDEYLEYFKQAVDLGDTVGDGAGAGDAWVQRRLGSDAAAGDKLNGDGAVQRGDGTREELERIARETGVFLVTGLIEKAGGSLYCAVVYVCPKLGIIGKRRKTQPVSAGFRCFIRRLQSGVSKVSCIYQHL